MVESFILDALKFIALMTAVIILTGIIGAAKQHYRLVKPHISGWTIDFWGLLAMLILVCI